MQRNIYLYRNGDSSDFIQTDTTREVIPIRLKTPFAKTSTWYRDGKWEVLPPTLEQQILDRMSDPTVRIADDDKYAYCEFTENMMRPQKPFFTDNCSADRSKSADMEDYTADEMRHFLDYRILRQRYGYNEKNKFDSLGISKDVYMAHISVDEESLTLSLTIGSFDKIHDNAIDNPAPDDYMPLATPYWESRKQVFDIKNGVVKTYEECNSPQNQNRNYCYEDEPDIKQLSLFELYGQHKVYLEAIEEHMPLAVDTAYKSLLSLAEKFTGLSMQRYIDNPPDVSKILMMYYMTLIPFEPLLVPVLYSNDMQERKLKFKYNRHDSLVLKKFFAKAHIKDYPFLRKSYNKRPQALLTYMRLAESGFKDINLFNRVLGSKDNYNRIDDGGLQDMVFFMRYAVGKRGQLPTLNLMLRNDNYYMWDSMNIFRRFFRHIPETLRRDILKDGFTQFNHDALSEISYKCQHKNRKFKWTNRQKSLEDSINGYEFRLPKDSDQLCEIGAFLHNCVASYSDKVSNQECIIVYATKNGQYELCIEVVGNEVRQELTNRNAHPSIEQQVALDIWHERHHLVR